MAVGVCRYAAINGVHMSLDAIPKNNMRRSHEGYTVLEGGGHKVYVKSLKKHYNNSEVTIGLVKVYNEGIGNFYDKRSEGYFVFCNDIVFRPDSYPNIVHV